MDVKGARQEIRGKERSRRNALNLLIPKGLAEAATPGAVKKAELLKTRESAGEKSQEDLLVKNLKSVESIVLKLTEKANEKGHLLARSQAGNRKSSERAGSRGYFSGFYRPGKANKRQ